MNTQSKCQKPIFIVGCGRSGTALLCNLLSQHPGLIQTPGYPDGEDHEGWIEHGHCVMAGIGSPGNKKYGSGINGFQYCLHMTKEDVTPEIIDGMHHHYTSVAGQTEKRVINKCCHLSNKLDYVLSIFPDAKIIHIIRDSEPTIASWMAVMHEHPTLTAYLPDEPFPCLWLFEKPKDPVAYNRLVRDSRFCLGGNEEIWLNYWLKTNTGIEQQMLNRIDQLAVVRYEDIIQSPAETLNHLTDFCQLKPHTFSVEHIDKNTAKKHKSLIKDSALPRIQSLSADVRERFGYIHPVPQHKLAQQLFVASK
ncbi:MAG: hypothetical protein RIR18_1680 [Pseudomonadota bacterium]